MTTSRRSTLLALAALALGSLLSGCGTYSAENNTIGQARQMPWEGGIPGMGAMGGGGSGIGGGNGIR